MVISIEIKPNKVSRFLGRTIGRTSRSLGAGIRGFKTEAKKEWTRTAQAPSPKAPAATLAA